MCLCIFLRECCFWLKNQSALWCNPCPVTKSTCSEVRNRSFLFLLPPEHRWIESTGTFFVTQALESKRRKEDILRESLLALAGSMNGKLSLHHCNNTGDKGKLHVKKWFVSVCQTEILTHFTVNPWCSRVARCYDFNDTETTCKFSLLLVGAFLAQNFFFLLGWILLQLPQHFPE